jgi:hypothetical protein
MAVVAAALLAAGLTAGSAAAQVTISTTEPGETAQEPEQDQDGVETITRAELAQLVYLVYAPSADAVPDPITAFADLRDFGLIPEHWSGSEIVTEGDLAEILQRLGVQYRPGSEDAPVSRAYVEALLRRHLGELRHYLGRRIAHGAEIDLILSERGGRPVSPDRF